MKEKRWPQLFVIYLRYLLGFAFIFASLVKIQGLRFTADSGAENPIDSAWHFFETLYESGLYWRFIGMAQFVTGALLVTQRYARLGTVLYLPVIANIFVITISYDFHGTPVITSLMLLSTLFLWYWEWDALKILFNQTPSASTKARLEHDSIWIYIGLVFLCITLVSKLIGNQNFQLVSFLLMALIGGIGLIIGYRRSKQFSNTNDQNIQNSNLLNHN